MKTILSIITALSLAACVADPSDDLDNSRNLRSDDTHGDLYDGVEQDHAAPSILDTERGDLDETLDNEVDDAPANSETAMPETLTVTR